MIVSEIEEDNPGFDYGDWLNSVIADAPTRLDTNLPTAFHTKGRTAESVPSHAVYGIRTPIEVPADKDFSIVGSEPEFGRAIFLNLTGTPNPITVKGSVQGRHRFGLSGITMVGGGVKVEGRHRGELGIRHCNFFETPGPAIDFTGDSIDLGATNLDVIDCEMTYCGGAVRYEGRTHASATLRDLRVIGSTATAVYIDTIGFRFENLKFFACSGDAYIHIGGDVERSSNQWIHGCRFGSEDISSADASATIPVPKQAILIGGATSGTLLAPGNIDIAGNEFNGNAVTNASPDMDYAVNFTDRPLRCVFRSNVVSAAHNVSVIGENYTAPGAQQNGFLFNQIAGGLTPFSGAGTGWRVEML